MPIVSHPEADEELVGAALWYEERHPGLGDDFLEAFEHTLRRIEAEPERWPKIRGEKTASSTSGASPTPWFTASDPMPSTSRPSCTSTAAPATCDTAERP